MKQDKTVLYLEYARIFACPAVILLHICSDFFVRAHYASREFAIINFYGGHSRWCVPLFVMISGALFLDPARPISLAKIWKKYIPHIFVILLFWKYFCPIVETLLKHESFVGCLNYLWTHPLFEPFYHLWYLYMILGLYMITPVLRRFTQSASESEIIVFLTLIFFVSFLLPNLLYWFPEAGNGFAIVSDWIGRMDIQGCGGYVGYYLAGYFLSRKNFNKKHIPVFIFTGMLGLFLTWYMNYQTCMRVQSNQIYFFSNLSPNVALTTVSLYCLIKALFQSAQIQNEKAFRCLLFLSKKTLGVYLFHPLILKFIWLHTTWISHIETHPLRMIPIVTILVWVGTYLLIFVISRIPFLSTVSNRLGF